MRIAKLRRIGPHDGRDAGFPKGRMVAAVHVPKRFSIPRVQLQRDDRALRNVTGRKPEQLLRNGIGVTVGEKSEEIADRGATRPGMPGGIF